MKHRNPLPDLLKGIAVILMIQVHLTELFANQEFYDSTLGKISLFMGGVPAAPLFMMVMGWFAFNPKPLRFELMRALKLLLIALVLNAALNASLFMKIAAGSLLVDGFAYLFGADILFLAALSLAAAALLKRLFRYKWWLLMLSALLVAAIAPYISSDVPTIGVWRYIRPLLADGYAWWSYFPLFPWMAYVLTGMAAAALADQQPQWLEKLNSWWMRIPIVLLFVAGAPYGWQVSTQLEQYYHHNIFFFLWALSAVGVWVYFWSLVPEIHNIGWIGQNVTKIYVVQWILIGNLGTWLYRSQSGAALGIWFMLISLITFSVVYAISRISHNNTDLI